MVRTKIAALLLAVSSGFRNPAVAQQDAGSASFLRWARHAAIALPPVDSTLSDSDLRSLGDMIGDARVVALGESTHGAAEPLIFRNRLAQYLIREKGFRAIAIESGIVEGRVVHDYVRYGRGQLDDVVATGFSWGFGRFPQNRALIEWLRDYNQRSASGARVDFFGFDVPGSPGNSSADPMPTASVDAALRFLAGVDSAAAVRFHDRLDALLSRYDQRPGGGYEQMPSSDRDRVTAAIADLTALLERNQARYTAASSAEEFAWGHQAAVGARQLDEFLRRRFNQAPSLDDGRSRNRDQADNIAWILQQIGPEGKLLVYAHDSHVSASPIINPDGGASSPAGGYLRQRLGDSLVIIGNIIGQGTRGCPNPGPLAGADFESPGAIYRLLRGLGRPAFLLDLRAAQGDVASWIHTLHWVTQPYQTDLGRAFDIVWYVDTSTPACS